MTKAAPLQGQDALGLAKIRARMARQWGEPAGRFRWLCMLISVCSVLLLGVMSSTSPWFELGSVAAVYFSGMVFISGAFVLMVFIRQRFVYLRSAPSDDSTNWYRDYLRNMPWWDLGFALGAITVTVASFTVYKTLALGAGGYHHDAAFIALDRRLLGGMDAWRWTHAIFPEGWMTGMIDHAYHRTFLPMMIGYAACIGLRGKPELRYTYMLSYLAGFVLVGMIAADIFDSAGPIFDGILFGDGSTFGELQARLQDQSAAAPTTIAATFAQDYLIAAFQENVVRIGSGISAMPSMHIVLAALWGIACWHLHKGLGIIFTLYGLMILIGSVHLGWHYLSDGLVGFLMIVAIWLLVGRVMGLFGPGRTG
jgi:hypothetical protein